MSLNETAPRYRFHANQSSQNVWTFDATGEDKDIHVQMSNDPEDTAKLIHEPLSLKVLTMIKEGEQLWRDDGRLVASDPQLISTTPPKSYSKERKTNWYQERIEHYDSVVNALISNSSSELGLSLTRKKD